MRVVPKPVKRSPRLNLGPDRGDAGLAFILLIPVLLIIVLHLINATQQLYERREAWAVAAAATRVGNQADPFQVRATRSPEVDEGKARDAIERFVADAGYRVNEVNFAGNANGTTDLTVEIEKDIDYIFPIPSGLAETITGRSESTLRVGVSTEGG